MLMALCGGRGSRRRKQGGNERWIEGALRLAPPKTKLDAIRIQRVSWQVF
jgi:hypothetical protein